MHQAVGKKLNDLIVQKVIISVLVIMVMFPLLEYVVVDAGAVNGLKLMRTNNGTSSTSQHQQQSYSRPAHHLPCVAGTANFPNMLLEYEGRIRDATKLLYYEEKLLFVEVYDQRRFLKDSSGKDYGDDPSFNRCFDNRANFFFGCPEAIRSAAPTSNPAAP